MYIGIWVAPSGRGGRQHLAINLQVLLIDSDLQAGAIIIEDWPISRLKLTSIEALDAGAIPTTPRIPLELFRSVLKL